MVVDPAKTGQIYFHARQNTKIDALTGKQRQGVDHLLLLVRVSHFGGHFPFGTGVMAAGTGNHGQWTRLGQIMMI
jgi:hypothetical protein